MSNFSKLDPYAALKWYDIMDIDSVVSPSKTEFFKKEKPQTTHSTPQSSDVNISSNSRILADSVKTVEELHSMVLTFEGCDLRKTAINTVFSDGVKDASVMFIGEAPGASEDAQGIPFCGDSGKLLDQMISTIGLSRAKNAYITNTIFWRPPANRRPTNEEIEICRPFVEKHIALVQPKLVVLVGATAVSCLLGNHLQISKIRQEYYQYTNKYLANPITTTAIFHPAYLLRQPYQKKATWYDLLKIQQFLKI